MNKTWVEVNNGIAGVPPTTSIQQVDYEYAVQWAMFDGRWKGNHWGILEDAQLERKQMIAGIWPENEVRIVRRVKAGPIEVVDGSA